MKKIPFTSQRQKSRPASVHIEDVTTKQLKTELNRRTFHKRYRQLLVSSVNVLAVISAFCILISFLLTPVLQIYGSSMNPTLTEGDVVVAMKKTSFERGDVVALYYSNRLLVKRVIALPFEWVNLDENGVFYVNGQPIEEDYVEELDFGEQTNTSFPLQVPENSYFVVGDHRSTSVDSRNTTIGCISGDDILGKLVLKVWPLNHFGSV